MHSLHANRMGKPLVSNSYWVWGKHWLSFYESFRMIFLSAFFVYNCTDIHYTNNIHAKPFSLNNISKSREERNDDTKRLRQLDVRNDEQRRLTLSLLVHFSSLSGLKFAYIYKLESFLLTRFTLFCLVLKQTWEKSLWNHPLHLLLLQSLGWQEKHPPLSRDPLLDSTWNPMMSCREFHHHLRQQDQVVFPLDSLPLSSSLLLHHHHQPLAKVCLLKGIREEAGPSSSATSSIPSVTTTVRMKCNLLMFEVTCIRVLLIFHLHSSLRL